MLRGTQSPLPPPPTPGHHPATTTSPPWKLFYRGDNRARVIVVCADETEKKIIVQRNVGIHIITILDTIIDECNFFHIFN